MRAFAWTAFGILVSAATVTVPASRLENRLPAELAGTTVIRGSDPAVIPVRLPRSATVATSHWSSLDLMVRGQGRFVGFALVPEDLALEGLLGGRLPKSAGFHKVMMPILGDVMHADFVQLYARNTTLPPGDYRLYLLPGSGPAKVTVKFHGLSGRTELTPREPVRYELKRPTVYSPGEVRNYYVAGTESELRRVGLIFQAPWIRTDAHLQGAFSFCWHDGSLPQPEELRYGPGGLCTGGGFFNDRKISLEPHVKIYYESVGPLEAGHYGQGLNFLAPLSLVRSVGHLMLWLNYD